MPPLSEGSPRGQFYKPRSLGGCRPVPARRDTPPTSRPRPRRDPAHPVEVHDPPRAEVCEPVPFRRQLYHISSRDCHENRYCSPVLHGGVRICRAGGEATQAGRGMPPCRPPNAVGTADGRRLHGETCRHVGRVRCSIFERDKSRSGHCPGRGCRARRISRWPPR